MNSLKSFFNLLTILVLCHSFYLFAQTGETASLKGRVLDSSTGEGIPNAGVYVSGTMIGTLTDLNGNYSLKNIPAGNQSRVASIVGYAPKIEQIHFEANKTMLQDFSITEQAIEMNTMQVTARSSKEWLKYLAIFKRYLLSKTELTDKCQILNEEAINLKRNKDGILEAECPCPLVIVNNELGYRIDCTLQKFNYNYSNDQAEIIFTLEAFSLKTDNEEVKQRWEKSAKNVFYFE